MASTPAAVVGDGSGAAVPQVAGGKSVLPKIAVPPDTPDLVAFDPDRDVKSPHAVLPSIEAAAEETGPANTPDAADAAAAADTSGGGPAANIDPTATATPDGDAPTDTTPSSADAAVPPAAADATTPPDANSATAPAPAVAAANATAEAGQPQPKATATTAADSADTGGAAVVVPNADQAGSAEAGVDLDLDEQKPLLLQGPGELPPTKVSGFNEDGTLDLSPGEQSRILDDRVISTYYEQKGIMQLFQEVTTNMYHELPDDPYEFLLERLERVEPGDRL